MTKVFVIVKVENNQTNQKKTSAIIYIWQYDDANFQEPWEQFIFATTGRGESVKPTTLYSVQVDKHREKEREGRRKIKENTQTHTQRAKTHRERAAAARHSTKMELCLLFGSFFLL
jgi:hypothetical protein